jgi:3-deoxy-D-manno-octulosonate 8-phosphate phosphatase (KDO 8-P phosphatase)
LLPQRCSIDIKELAKYISSLQGGTGCARDVIEKVMKLQHNWNEDITVRAQ